MILKVVLLVFICAAFLSLPLTAQAQVKVTFDHNPNATATSAFKFKNVPSPLKDDAAARAKLLLIEGEVDGNGADLSALTDGALPTEEDQPAVNFFWNAGTGGGRFQMDLGNVIDIATHGWKLITVVDTRSKEGDDGGQFGVSITDARGSLGKFRYLLFDCYVTETADEFGNTFYSEIDVIAKK